MPRLALLASDEEMAQWLRRQVDRDKVLVVVNKAENQRARQGMSLTVHDCYRLGFGEPIAVSAATGEGMVDLYVALQPFIDDSAARTRVRAACHSLPPSAPPQAMAGSSRHLAASGSRQPGSWQQASASVKQQPPLQLPEEASAPSWLEDPGTGSDSTWLGSTVAEAQEGSLKSAGPAQLQGHSAAQAGLHGQHYDGDAAATVQHGQHIDSSAAEVGLHGQGFGDTAAAAAADELSGSDAEEEDAEGEEAEGEDAEGEDADELDLASEELGPGVEGGGDARTPIRLAILGQPNVGKSTLLNCLLKEPRALTGPEPGLTRDSVRADMTHNGIHLELVDTAGWIGVTRSPKYDDVGGAIADMARRESARALAAAHVAVLVLDAERAVQMQRVMTQRELALAGLALAEGRALVLAANKLDVLSLADRNTYLTTLRSTLEDRFLEAGTLPVVGMSALTGKGAEALLPAVLESFKSWNKRVTTGRLNRFVLKLQARLVGGSGSTGAIMQRIKYMTQVALSEPTSLPWRAYRGEAAQRATLLHAPVATAGMPAVPWRALFWLPKTTFKAIKPNAQVKARPPSFAAFLSGSQPVSEDFVRFLAKELRQALGFQGVPVRIWFRYKEARSASLKAMHSRRGRPLALRGGLSRQKAAKAVKASRTSHARTFLSKAKSILGDLSSGGGVLEGRKKAEAEGHDAGDVPVTQVRRAWKGAGGDSSGQGDPPADKVARSGAGSGSRIQATPHSGGAAAAVAVSAVSRGAGFKKGSTGITGSVAKGPLSKAQLMARLLVSHKPSAPLFHAMPPKRRKASGKGGRAVATAGSEEA